jgi:hypothetical protein
MAIAFVSLLPDRFILGNLLREEKSVQQTDVFKQMYFSAKTRGRTTLQMRQIRDSSGGKSAEGILNSGDIRSLGVRRFASEHSHLPLNNFQSGFLLLPTNPYEFQKVPLRVVSCKPKPQKNAGDSPDERLVCEQSREICCAPASGRV